MQDAKLPKRVKIPVLYLFSSFHRFRISSKNYPGQEIPDQPQPNLSHPRHCKRFHRTLLLQLIGKHNNNLSLTEIRKRLDRFCPMRSIIWRSWITNLYVFMQNIMYCVRSSYWNNDEALNTNLKSIQTCG